MNRGEIVALVAARLGQRTGLTATIVLELQAAQSRLETDTSIMPWFLRQTDLTRTADGYSNDPKDNTVTLPTGFLYVQQPIGFSPLRYLDSANIWQDVEKIPAIPFMTDEDDNSTPGAPLFCAFPQEGTYAVQRARISPRPDAAYEFQLYCYIADDVLTSDGVTNKWSAYAPELLIAETGRQVARSLRDRDAVALFGEDRQLALARLLDANLAHELNGGAIELADQ